MAALNKKKYVPVTAFPISATTSEEGGGAKSDGERAVIGEGVETATPQIILAPSQLKTLLENSGSANERWVKSLTLWRVSKYIYNTVKVERSNGTASS